VRMRVVFEDRWRVLSWHQADTVVPDIVVLAPAGEPEPREALISTAGEERWVELRLCRRHHYKEKIISILILRKI
jgi:hypothetical protein